MHHDKNTRTTVLYEHHVIHFKKCYCDLFQTQTELLYLRHSSETDNNTLQIAVTCTDMR
jgi:hypothetical protein